MNPLKLALTISLAVLPATTALADGKSAAAAYFANLERAGIAAGNASAQTTVATPTFVKGMYRLNMGNPNGTFVAYISESGTIAGDANGFQLIQPKGLPRPLTPAERTQLGQEIVHHIDVDQLVEVRYGDGGGAWQVLFSAVDCPYCAKFEASMAKVAKGVNTRFYVVPSALRPTSYGAQPFANWQTAARIWCAPDKSAAWLAYWAKRTVPPASNCSQDARGYERRVAELGEILKGVGLFTATTPALLRSDGRVITPKPDFDRRYVDEVLRDGAKFNEGARTDHWLSAEAAAYRTTPSDVMERPTFIAQAD